ncbi:hypothetical protein M409DRAFT_53450 [Zasmidium cellare ATCC 36951]|uniref:Uncharacterized protein n=1 Tax=Zasmidium cellare ATCC 36951 TaxID=1080233 RepID=A0A6A6CPI3_ZASCE|nr:uncharacterized protein M409DRAFT_53450 [Zasmidium cellare ATCC 36951]KAF2168138.1 hypothetical protein M409DRAFT_53450 [Zasmidium cellare ATCC 36951]
MDNRHRNFAGKALLYRTIDSPKWRVFLRRNVRDALDSHERDLAREQQSDATVTPKCEDREDSTQPEWEPPSDRMMEPLLEYQKPTLRISALHLRHPQEPPRPRNNDEPSWLRQSDSFIRPCQVRVSTWDRRVGNTIMYNEPRHARIVGRDNSNGRVTFDVFILDPFNIPIEQISCPTPSFTGKGPWERRLEESCVLECDVQFQDSKSTAEFLNLVEGRPLNEYHTAAANEGIVKIKWSNLPQVPKDGELLQMKRAKGHKSLDMEYGAEITMGWNERTDMPFTRHSKAVRARREELRQLPTPVSEDLEAGRNKYTIKYSFRGSAFEVRTFLSENLKCIFCLQGGEHTSFDRLLLHYHNHHDHFNFEVEHRPQAVKAIRITHADDEYLEREFGWVAPRRAFDINGHLNGTDDWTSMMFEKREGPQGTPRQRKEKFAARPAAGKSPSTNKSRQNKVPGLKLANPKRKFTEPEQVEDLVPQVRKKNKVPHVPGVVFYRTTSKQILKPGDEISDSDEDVDDTWMKQTQRHDLKKMGEDGISLDFNELFNRQLDEEQPMSDTLTSDAIVRFARRWVDLLKDPKWKEKFQAKLTQLETRRILREETVKYCMDLVEAAQKKDAAEETSRGTSGTPQRQGANTANTPSRVITPAPKNSNYSGKVRMRWLEGALRLTDEQGVPQVSGPADKNPTPTGVHDTTTAGKAAAPTMRSRPLPKPCVCGTNIMGKMGTIACANVKCPTEGFHMACVGLENRSWDWRCGECSSS